MQNESSESAEDQGRMFIAEEILDRSSISNNSNFQENVLNHSETRYIICFQGKCLLKDCKMGRYEPFLFLADELPFTPIVGKVDVGYELVYLGRSSSGTSYVCIVSKNDEPYVTIYEHSVFKSLRDASESIEDPHEVALLAQAVSFATWHYRTRHCVKCGSKVVADRQGHARRCQNSVNCGVASYPRLEPAVIQLVESPCGGFALLGRKAVWPPGRYSCLAGFVELGETVEQCVQRETKEEAGVDILPSSVVYKRSQPWPFPSSLMIAFFAKAVGNVDSPLPEITVQIEEMEDVQWFSRNNVLAALDGTHDTLRLPGNMSLARSLIAEWAQN
jgi:NAD+ diphosphatase